MVTKKKIETPFNKPKAPVSKKIKAEFDGHDKPIVKKPKTPYYQLTNDQRQLIAMMAGGLTPIELFISIMRTEDCPLSDRIDAAKAAAPYMHRKMPIAIEGGDPSKPINLMDVAQLKNLSTAEITTLLATLRKAGANIS